MSPAPNLHVLPWIGTGLAVALGLTLARERWIWFPFHAMGFAMANTYTAGNFWFPYLMAFIVKAFVLR
ncbi:MAG TPA: DUF6784 domain-containing protein [Armatimonadota bacterium]|nr:DUF6784 domain-containing protein [Armatimonadota bacterium]